MTNLVVLKGYKTKNFIYCNGCFGGKKKKIVVICWWCWQRVLGCKYWLRNEQHLITIAESIKYRETDGQTDNGTDGCCVGLTDNVYCLKKNYVAYTYFCHIFF